MFHVLTNWCVTWLYEEIKQSITCIAVKIYAMSSNDTILQKRMEAKSQKNTFVILFLKKQKQN